MIQFENRIKRFIEKRIVNYFVLDSFRLSDILKDRLW